MKFSHIIYTLAACTLTPELAFAQDSQKSWDVSSTSKACGYVMGFTAPLFDAVYAYNCLISTPFDREIAKSLLSYWKDTIQFQSTLAYLKNPPKAYQQAAVDLNAGFDLIQQQIETGIFTNQYTFEAAVHQLLYSAHDGHVGITSGLVGVFQFVSPFYWTTVSSDGFSLPEVYDYVELVNAQNGLYDPSPVELINNQTAEQWLSQFASRNSHGFLESHGEWNQIMYTQAGYGTGGYDGYRSTVFYPGDTVTVQYKNGTVTTPRPWMAKWSRHFSAPIIQTGEDFYDYFVLGLDTPSNIAMFGPQDTATPSLSIETPTMTATAVTSALPSASNPPIQNLENGLPGWGYAYPQIADVVQPQLAYGGVLTGYFINESNLAVLSIPSFENDERNPTSFTDTVAAFLRGAKQAGMTKVLIDLQQNFGGTQLLATDTFKHFFPNADPFSGMRARTFDKVDALGSTFTQCFHNQNSSFDVQKRNDFINSPFMISTEFNAANGKPFDSWEDYNGPHADHDDTFTAVSRYNLSDSEFVKVAARMPDLYGYASRPANESQPFDAKDIVILTDGTCASACDLFIEMMHHEAGVKTIAVGGVPQYGPMQARGGTRGALTYSSADIDRDIAAAWTCNASVQQILPERPDVYRQVTNLNINIRDQVRKGEDNFPLQFAYEAADCRIFWTFETFDSFPALWEYAASATFYNGSTCVLESDAFKNTMQTDMTGPSEEQKKNWRDSNPALKPAPIESDIKAIEGLIKKRPKVNTDDPKPLKPTQYGEDRCDSSIGCSGGTTCLDIRYCNLVQDPYGNYPSTPPLAVCRSPCSTNSDCTENFTCEPDSDYRYSHCTPIMSAPEANCWSVMHGNPPLASRHAFIPAVQATTNQKTVNQPGTNQKTTNQPTTSQPPTNKPPTNKPPTNQPPTQKKPGSGH